MLIWNLKRLSNFVKMFFFCLCVSHLLSFNDGMNMGIEINKQWICIRILFKNMLDCRINIHYYLHTHTHKTRIKVVFIRNIFFFIFSFFFNFSDLWSVGRDEQTKLLMHLFSLVLSKLNNNSFVSIMRKSTF